MSFYTDVIKKSPWFNSINVCKDTALLEPSFRAKVQAVLEQAHNDGHDLRISETFRSQARQMYLFQHGATQLKNVGVHNFGLACDFALFEDGKYVGDGEKYRFLVDYAKKFKLVSGIDWGTPWQKHTFVDSGHVQDVPVFRQGELFALTWYPDANYNPVADEIAHFGAVAKKFYA